MPTIVHFGAGNIGRSLVGSLFAGAGWRVVFVDAVPEIVQALKTRGSYVVRVRDTLPPGTPDTIEVRGVTGLAVSEQDAITREVKNADLLSTAVGARFLPGVLQSMIPGLKLRKAPVSILFCENLRNAAALARQTLSASLPDLSRIGLVETSIGKMVPIMPDEVRKRDPLEVWAEAYNRIVADAAAFVGGIPEVPGLVCKASFQAYVDRKLFIHNLGHAVAAYHGHLAGHRFIWECMADAKVRNETQAVMQECAIALQLRYPGVFSPTDLQEHIDDLLRRFANQALGDTVFRVGRDLARKLGPEDRCIGALRLITETGGNPAAVCRAIAAAFRFRAVDEAGAPAPTDVAFLQQTEKEGLSAMLQTHCGLDPVRDASLIRKILAS